MRTSCLGSAVVLRSTSLRTPGLTSTRRRGLDGNLAGTVIFGCPTFSQRRFIDTAAMREAKRISNIEPDRDEKAQWREYWDAEKKCPYYVNTVTFRQQLEKPSCLESRFSDYWAKQPKKKNDNNNNAKGGSGEGDAKEGDGSSATESGGERSSTNPVVGWFRRAKRSLGPEGFLIYATVHFCGWLIIYVLLLQGVDVVAVARRFGFHIQSNPDDQKKKLSLKTAMALWVLAVGLNKLLVPVQLALTLLLTPTLGPRIRPAARTLMNRFRSKNAQCDH